MGEMRPISSLGTWALIRQAVRSPEALAKWRARHPDAAAAEDDALEVARRLSAAPAPTPAPVVDDLEDRMRAAGAPPKELAAWLSKHETPALGYVRAWLDDSTAPPMLVLSGGPGCGKTVAALEALASSIREAQRARYTPGRFATANALSVLSLWGADELAWDAAMRSRLLVLDDLGSENVNEQWRARRDELIGHRYSVMGKTVITTNIATGPLLDPKGPLGARIASRFQDGARVVACGAVDLRRKTK